MKYVFVKKFETGETSIGLIDDPNEVYKSGEYKPDNGDKIYQLGQEVKVKVSLETVPSYRGDVIKKSKVTRVRGDTPASPEVSVWTND